jgi:hypothetical protein
MHVPGLLANPETEAGVQGKVKLANIDLTLLPHKRAAHAKVFVARKFREFDFIYLHYIHKRDVTSTQLHNIFVKPFASKWSWQLEPRTLISFSGKVPSMGIWFPDWTSCGTKF